MFWDFDFDNTLLHNTFIVLYNAYFSFVFTTVAISENYSVVGSIKGDMSI